MRVLLVKMSSLGDVVHALPAVTDMVAAGHQVSWVVEEAFAPIVQAHPGVSSVIPIAWRRWRKRLLANGQEMKAFWRSLRAEEYELVLDAQGLYKSAAVARMARGASLAGLDANSAREPLATRLYQQHHAVAKPQHAVARVRQLAGLALGYEVVGQPQFGLQIQPGISPSNNPRTNPNPSDEQLVQANAGEPQPLNCLFLHGTTWSSKHWPETYWQALAVLADAQGARVNLLWGDAVEQQRAQRIADAAPAASTVWPKQSLADLLPQLAAMDCVIGVDSGLTHLTAALGVPTVAIYGSTDAQLTGAQGAATLNLQADFACVPCRQRDCQYAGQSSVQPACYETLPPDRVWRQALQQCHRADRILPL